MRDLCFMTAYTTNLDTPTRLKNIFKAVLLQMCADVFGLLTSKPKQELLAQVDSILGVLPPIYSPADELKPSNARRPNMQLPRADLAQVCPAAAKMLCDTLPKIIFRINPDLILEHYLMEMRAMMTHSNTATSFSADVIRYVAKFLDWHNEQVAAAALPVASTHQ
jgi:hypothetical protein